MNCQEFNNIIDELADYKPMPDAVRDASVSHAALCPTCAANLADAREVSRYLVQAARAESEMAPANVKANLLAAFERSTLVQRATSNVPRHGENTHVDVRRWTLDFGRILAFGQVRWFAAAAVAAVVLLAVIFPILRRASSPVSSPPSKDLIAVSSGSPSPASDNRTVSPIEATPTPDKLPAAPKANPLKPSSRKHRAPANRTETVENVARNSGEYLPLTYFTEGTAIESGTVVRVELSRSALASLGFTGGINSSDDSVKAEVILGDDGVARAIRLVE